MASGKGRLWVTAIIAVAVVVIAAVIVLYPHEIDVTSEGDGKVIPSGGTEMRFTETLRLEIVPEEDTVTYVYVDGELKAQDVTSFEFRVSALDFDKHTITVVFQKVTPPEPEKEFTLSVTSEGEGTVTPSGETKYTKGTVVTVKAMPGSGIVVSDIIIDGVSAGPGGSVQVRMDSNHDVKVVFRPVATGDVPVTISVDVDLDIVVETLGAVSDYGEVVPSGTVYVAPHGSLTITVILNPGFEMKNMTVDGISYGAVTEHTITDITKSVSVEISIVKKVQGFVIKASAGTGGSISPSGDVKVEKEKDMTFTFTPASGYKVSTLTIDGKTIAPTSNSYTFTDVQSAHTIAVTFQATGGSGGGGGGGTTKVLTSIRIINPPTKTSYYVGEPFDPNGMKVNAVYSDGTESEITSFTYSPTGDLTIDVDYITVTYQGKTAAQAISVTQAPTLQSISVDRYPTLTYSLGDTFDPTGLEIKVTYSDGSYEIIDSGFTVQEKTFDSYGTDSVTVTYTENGVTVTCSISVTVRDPGAFTATVISYTGTKVKDGSVVQITGYESISTSLSSFIFDTRNIVPGIRQTIVIDVTNRWPSTMDASISIGSLNGCSDFADQIRLTLSYGETIVSKTLTEVATGGSMSLGQMSLNDSKRVTFTFEFMNLPENNRVMDKQISFTITVNGEESRSS